jgi:mRNA interferase RelE/StbE
MKVELSDQVFVFVRSLPPEPRKRLREALRRLASERGDLRALEGDLAGFHRLRVGRFRVIFRYAMVGHAHGIRCEFADERSIIYQVFAEAARHLQAP